MKTKSLAERQFIIINVGANTKHRGLVSPLWEDETFFFMPIPEEGEVPDPSKDLFPDCPNLPTFADFVRPQIALKPEIALCVSEKYLTKRVHDDPEFETFTYGDNPEDIGKGRAANLKKYLNEDEGDLLFFFAGLTAIRNGKLTSDYKFYFIGFFEISRILPKVTPTTPQDKLTLFRRNAHIRRGQADPGFFKNFWVWKGSDNSQRFDKAVLFDQKLGAEILVSSSGVPYSWPESKSPVQPLGQRTRASRRLTSEQGKRILLERVIDAGNDVPLFRQLLVNVTSEVKR
jgi:hypothetical protein